MLGAWCLLLLLLSLLTNHRPVEICGNFLGSEPKTEPFCGCFEYKFNPLGALTCDDSSVRVNSRSTCFDPHVPVLESTELTVDRLIEDKVLYEQNKV